MFEVSSIETGRQTRREALVTLRNSLLGAAATVGFFSGIAWLDGGPDIQRIPFRHYYLPHTEYRGGHLTELQRLIPSFAAELSQATGRAVNGAGASVLLQTFAEELAQQPVTTSYHTLADAAHTHQLYLSYCRYINAYNDTHTGITYDAFLPLLATTQVDEAASLIQSVAQSEQAQVEFAFAIDAAGNRLTLCQVH